MELEALSDRMSVDGLIVMHDIETFYHDTGMAKSYSNGESYPREVIEEYGKKMGSMGDALIVFLANNRFKYKLLYYVPESHGAVVIRRTAIPSHFTFMVPGDGAIYANKKGEE